MSLIAQIQFSITLFELLLGILVIAGIVVLILLAKTLMSLSKTMDQLSQVVGDNKENLDKALKSLPGIAKSAENVMGEADIMLKDAKPNLLATLTEVQGITSNVNKLSGDAKDTVEFVALSAVDTLDHINTGVSSATDYVALIKSILESIKSVFGK